MSGKVMVRLFFASSCGSGCGCGPNEDVAALELVAGKLVKKFGVEHLEFEAYSAVDLKAYPYLRKAAGKGGKISLPAVSVNETVLAPGAIPSYSEIEKEVAKCRKVV